MHSLRCHFAIHFLDPDCPLANMQRLPMREGESEGSTADLRALREHKMGLHFRYCLENFQHPDAIDQATGA
jgi:hypothetical protein